MGTKPGSRPVRHVNARAQERGERTRALVIDETIRCIREEGFAAASTRHIIERAGVSWGVIQYYFGDREGLLRSVIDHANTTLTASLNQLADTAEEIDEPAARAEALTAAAWEIFFTPTAMTALEILIATRAMQGSLTAADLSGVVEAIGRVGDALSASTPHSSAVANLLWSSPVGMMVAQMVMTDQLPTAPERAAMAALIGDHLNASLPQAPAPAKKRSRRAPK